MTLLQRYVEAVKRYLPAESRDDTAHELASLLQDELDEVAERKGALLDDVEVVKFLRRYGHPYLVAARYRKRRTLIDEAVYPLYKRVLALVLSALLLVSVVISLGRLSTTPDAASAAHTVPLFINDVLGSVLFGFALVTLGFHWLGDRLAGHSRLWRFDPATLPAADVSFASVRLASTVWNIIVLVLTIALLQTLRYPWGGDVDVRLSPVALPYILPLQAVALSVLLVHVTNLFQRYWTRTKLYVLAALRALSALLLLCLLPMPHLLTAAVADQGHAGQAAAARFMDVWPSIWVKVFLTAVIIHLAWSAWKVLRRTKAVTLPAG